MEESVAAQNVAQRLIDIAHARTAELAKDDGLDALTMDELRSRLTDLKRRLRRFDENAALESFLKRHVSVRGVRGGVWQRRVREATRPLSPSPLQPAARGAC